MLTISQLAGYCGVTPRAVRHYHRLGLLAEPARSASGYRLYDAQDVVDLRRVKTFAAGLAEVRADLERTRTQLDSLTQVTQYPLEASEAWSRVITLVSAKMAERGYSS